MAPAVVTSFLGGLIYVAGAATTPTPPTGPSPILYLFAAILGGGIFPVLVNAWRRHSRGPIEDEDMVQRTVSSQMEDMRKWMADYKVEIEVTKRQIEDYRKQLNEMTHELARAQVRISQLEEELRRSKDNRERLRVELEDLTRQRDALTLERERLANEAGALRDRVDRLEAFAREMHPTPKTT